MRSMTALATGFALLAGAQIVLASEPRAGKNPYGRLFEPQPVRVAPVQASRTPADDLKPRVVCGMTVIPADPSIDPKIRIKREDSQTRYTIRAVPPPICK
jgi:hypothetical protein